MRQDEKEYRLPSLIDRLRPEQSGSGSGLGAIKEAVCRDIENLLNTRVRRHPTGAQWKELETSLINYGIPDFTGENLGSVRSREEFRRMIERTIRRCEPRFKSVRVQLTDEKPSLDRTLRFRIDAVLDLKPTPEPVVFDTALKTTSATFEVKRAGR